MKFASVVAVVALLIGFSTSAQAAPAAAAVVPQTASSVVQELYNQLTATMKQGEQLGFTGRFRKLEPVIKNAYNMPWMTRFAVGTTWPELDAAKQKQLTDSFTAFSIATYASRFTKFDGEKFEIISEKPASGGGMIVETHLTPKDSDFVTLNYLVRADETGKLRIVDVLLDASISELATRRAEFNAVVKRDGHDALISALDAKTKKMGPL